MRPQMQQRTVIMRGGLDLVSKGISVPPGALIACQNYEATAEGYVRSEGYERFDGQHKPSATTIAALNFDVGTSEPSVGDTITGGTSGATGILIEAPVLTSGTWGGGDAAGEMILRNLSGTFADNEALEVSMSQIATADGTQDPSFAEDAAEQATYLATAVAAARADIDAVPGSGPVRGVATYKGDVYAWRNNSGGTALDMFKATASGWSQQTFGHTLDLSATTGEFAEGEVITGGTSGATATVERAVLTSGTWGSGVAYLVLSGISGTFQAAEAITGDGSGAGTAGGAQAAITLAADGKVRWEVHNFYGASNLVRLYFVTGQGKGHEWDGSVLAPIRTGLSDALDKPTYIGVHANHLFFAYDGGHIQHSGTGLPLSYLAADNAGTFSVGQDVTSMVSRTKTALIIATTNQIAYLSGSSVANFSLQFVSEDSGAVAGTMQVVGQPYFLDDQGVRSLEAAEAFGDWKMGTATRRIAPLLQSSRGRINAVGALRVREKDQYRLFFDDGTGVTIYFGRGEPECMTFYNRFSPFCLASGEDDNGEEILLAGGDDGYVYELDAGTSQDGSNIEHYIRTGFMHQGYPNVVKRFHSALFEVGGAAGGATLSVAADFAYGQSSRSATSPSALAVYGGGGGFWDQAIFDEFVWSSLLYENAQLRLSGLGENVSFVLLGETDDEEPHVVSTLTVNYMLRRQVR